MITVSETWAKKSLSTQLFKIGGFNVERQDRDLGNTTKKRGGGLITYINANKFPDYVVLDKLSTSTTFTEAMWIKIKRRRCKDLVVCNLYRPPNGNLKDAIDYLNKSLLSINISKVDLYIMGDMNIDYLNKASPFFKKLNFFEKSNSLTQIISETIRHTDKSSTLLDLILTNDKHVTMQGTLNLMISDHQPIFVVKKKLKERHKDATFRGRPYSKLNLEDFKNRLANLNFDNIYEIDDPDTIWDYIIKHIQDDLDVHCPVQTSRFRNFRPDWINNDLLEQIKDRDYFYTKAKRTKDVDDWNIAKHLRNTTNRNIRMAKADFIISKLSQYKDDSAKFWKEIRSVFPTKDKTTKKKNLLEDENSQQIREENTAQYINEFFVNVGNRGDVSKQCNAAQRVPLAVSDSSNLDEQSLLEEIGGEEVLQIIRRINIHKSSGIENINNMVLRVALKTLVKPLTYLFNQSLKTSIFPEVWKKQQ